jgi:hypothetical protein
MLTHLKLEGINNSLHKFILYHSAPTLLGVKPASLINFTQGNQLYPLWLQYSFQQFKGLLAILNQGRNIDFYKIHHQPGERALILFYNPEMLTALLIHPENRKFLNALGYSQTLNTRGHLQRLAQKFATTLAFPHEIGMFLGIPLGDVNGFIVNKGKNYIFNQYWKVYQNPQMAKKVFAAYDQAKIDIIHQFNFVISANNFAVQESTKINN